MARNDGLEHGQRRPAARKGRPRLTQEDLDARIQAYRRSYGVKPGDTGDKGLPPFPSGKRETRQHREWISLYKLWNRLGRRQRGQCERCANAASEGSIFCEEHRAQPTAGAAGASSPSVSLEDRRALWKAQDGRCPICAEKVELLESTPHQDARAKDARADAAAARPRALLHSSCHRLVRLAEDAGTDVVDGLRRYLWPSPRTRR